MFGRVCGLLFRLLNAFSNRKWLNFANILFETKENMRTVCKCFFVISLNGLDIQLFIIFFNSNYHKSKTEKQLSQRAQLCCILLGLCASTAVTKVFEPICCFFLRFSSLSHSLQWRSNRTAIMTYGLRSGGTAHTRPLQWTCATYGCLALARSRTKWEHLSILCRKYKGIERPTNFAYTIEDETVFELCDETERTRKRRK